MAGRISKNSIVQFTGGGIYASSTAAEAGRSLKGKSTCRVTNINEKGAHPYHCISQDGKGVYGWVDSASVAGTEEEKKEAEKKETEKKAQANKNKKKKAAGTLQDIRKTEKKKTEKKAGKIGTLGDIVFTVSAKTIQTFDGLQVDSGTNYAKHTRHNKKPLLEFQYNDTDTASFTIYLSVFLGVNPGKMQDKIDKYRKKGKILTLVIGGKKYGKKWVITKHSKGYERFDNKGNLLAAKSSISLEEYAER